MTRFGSIINVRRGLEGNLSRHCRSFDQHGCMPVFDECLVVRRHAHALTREIIEASLIVSELDKCISAASIFFARKLDTLLGHPIVNFRNIVLSYFLCYWFPCLPKVNFTRFCTSGSLSAAVSALPL